MDNPDLFPKKRIMSKFIRSFFSAFLIFLCLNPASTQTGDSISVFTESAFLDWVRQYHPIVRSAGLLNRAGQAYQQKARGGFDPKMFADVEHKSYDGKNYFTIGNTGLKIPSWMGVEFKTGFNWTNGIFLNPENNLPTAGQAYAGLTWSLGRGLIIDERRATLQKAELVVQANEAERQEIINDLLLEAGKAYWEWVHAYNRLKVYEEALELAKFRLEGVRVSFFQGDKPAIDTLESLIQVQNRQLAVNDAEIEYENNRLNLSNFLWYQDQLPLEVSELLRPPLLLKDAALPGTGVDIGQTLLNLQDAHPTLRQYRLKLKQLEIDRRLKKEQLKPQVDVEFNFLADGFDFVNGTGGTDEINGLNALLTENYKVGVRVGMPLFRFKERGDLELANIKLADTDYKIRQKAQEIRNKVLNYEGQLDNLTRQVQVNQAAIENYQSLLVAENDKFRFGESSIFLLNSREQKLIEARLKLVKLQTMYYKNRLSLTWSAGQLQ